MSPETAALAPEGFETFVPPPTPAPAVKDLADLTRDEHLAHAQRFVERSRTLPAGSAIRYLALAQIHATLAGPTPAPIRNPRYRRTPEKTETAP